MRMYEVQYAHARSNFWNRVSEHTTVVHAKKRARSFLDEEVKRGTGVRCRIVTWTGKTTHGPMAQ